MEEDKYKFLFTIFIYLTIFTLIFAIGVYFGESNMKKDILKSSNHSNEKPTFLSFNFDDKKYYFNVEKVDLNNYLNYVNVSLLNESKYE